VLGGESPRDAARQFHVPFSVSLGLCSYLDATGGSMLIRGFLVSIAFAVIATSVDAMTLQKCEGIVTSQGFKWVGTYCVDYACTYITTRVFDNYCPFSID
jgi:hypothetical protein